MNETLKPCPFCGGEAHTVVEYDSVGMSQCNLSAFVECKKCGTTKRVKFAGAGVSFDDYYKAFDEVINKWNERVKT